MDELKRMEEEAGILLGQDMWLAADAAPSSLPGMVWYEGVSLETAEKFIRSNLQDAARNVIATGYYLKTIRDRKLYLEAGYENIWDYAYDRYGFSMSTASRYMSRNDKFSKGGNSPVLDEKYREYNKSQLQEMLSLDEEQLEKVTPDMTARQIRELKKPKETPVPYVEIPGQIELTDFPGITAEEVEQAREETSAVQQRGTYTVTAEDLLPAEPEQESVATSQIAELDPTEKNTGKCLHRPEFNCTLAEADKKNPGNGQDCTHNCCWNCPKHGTCRLECYASAQRPENAAKTQQDEPEENAAPVFTSELSNNNAYGYTWHQVVRAYLSEVHRARSNEEDRNFPDAVFNSYGYEYQAPVKGEQVWFLMEGEVQFIVNMDRLNQEYDFFYPAKKEKLSAYGTEKKIYPSGSLIATPGCKGGHDCFSCGMECQIRQADRYCREAPMGNPFPCEILIWGLQNQRDEVGDRCQFINHDLAEHCAGSGEADPCCKNCSDPCEYICGRAMRKLDKEPEEVQTELREEEDPGLDDNVIDAEYTEVEAPSPDKLGPVRAVLRKESAELNAWMKAFEGEPEDRIPPAIGQKKIIVAALAAMLSDLEDEKLKELQEQPELPVMRNNDQRKEFLNAFHDWPVWFKVPEASEVYYRYDLPDRTALVICEYKYYAEWMEGYRYGDGSPEKTGTREYLLTPGYHYLADRKSNRSLMIEKLKEIQKKGTDADE